MFLLARISPFLSKEKINSALRILADLVSSKTKDENTDPELALMLKMTLLHWRSMENERTEALRFVLERDPIQGEHESRECLSLISKIAEEQPDTLEDIKALELNSNLGKQIEFWIELGFCEIELCKPISKSLKSLDFPIPNFP